MTKEIKLGHKVREITTGTEGLATSVTRFLTGNVQISVQAPGKDGAVPEQLSYDLQQLDYLDDGIAARVTPAPASTGITLGEKVQDIVTGFAGIAIREATFMNGCIYYEVASEVAADSHTKTDFVEYKRLKVVGKGVVAAIAAKAEPAGVKPTGGPNTRMMKRG